MVDPIVIGLLVTVSTLLIERTFAWLRKIKKSQCCGGSIELEPDDNKPLT